VSESFSTPPVLPGELALPVRRAVWPIVLGVISIVVGILACLYAAAGTAMSMLLPALGGWTSYTPRGTTGVDVAALMRDHAWLLRVAYSQLGVGAALLVIAGIGLVRRRPWGARLMRIWGVLGVLLALGSAASVGVFEARFMGAAFTSISASSGSGGGPPPQVGYVAGVFTGVIMAFLLSIFPVFVLIWFSLAPVRAEVGRWTRARSPSASAAG
jgi:hypothetical protein